MGRYVYVMTKDEHVILIHDVLDEKWSYFSVNGVAMNKNWIKWNTIKTWKDIQYYCKVLESKIIGEFDSLDNPIEVLYG